MKPRGKRNAVKAKQRQRAAASKRREDDQLAGRVETLPAGAVRNNEVSQSSWEPALPELVLQAAREDWSTPGPAKRRAVLALLHPIYVQDTVLDKDGNQVRVPPNHEQVRKNVQALAELDQIQWERDNPVEAGKAKGSVNQQVNVGIDWTAMSAQQPTAADPLQQKIEEVKASQPAIADEGDGEIIQ